MKSTELFDSHIHTMFSSDSDESPENIIEKAISSGLRGICFTDHNDFGYFSPEGESEFDLDFESYSKKISEMKIKYKDKIDILFGLEQGLYAKFHDSIESFDPGKTLDFIIGSTHVVDGIDPYYDFYWESAPVSQGIVRYFETVFDSVCSFNNFNVYGHLDYIVRYIPDLKIKSNPMPYIPMDLVAEILKKLIQKGKGIEINTGGLRKGCSLNPAPKILKLYKDLGGEIITLGSDAHRADHVASDFNIALKELKDSGFKYYAHFKAGKPIFTEV